MTISSARLETLASKKNFAVFVLLHALFLFVILTGIKEQFIVMIGLFPIAMIAILQFEVLFFILPVFLFINLHFYGFSAAEFGAGFLIISFILTHFRIDRKELGTAPIVPILLYLCVLFISALKSVDVSMTLILILHFVLFVSLMVIFGTTISEYRVVRNIVYLIVGMVFLNSLDVFVTAASTGARAFGFAGIMFVDYVGMGIVIMFIMLVFASTDRERRISGAIMILFVIASILTQTRNSWITTFITITILMTLIQKKHRELQLRMGIIGKYILTGGLVLVMAVLLAMVINPETFNRLKDVSDKSDVLISETGEVKNSFISRLLIWHTAYNGFMANPLLGVGAYSFPLSSMYYYTIPEQLYTVYVEKLTPHQTYIAVIVETGLIGLLIFSSMIVAMLKYTWKVMNLYVHSEEKKIVFALGSGILYICISMFTTDAWLWGHGIVLFGIVFGCIVAAEHLLMIRRSRGN